MKILVFGTGGIGGFLSAALARIHPDTYVYARGENAAVIEKEGIHVQSVTLGDFTAHPQVVTRQNIGKMGAADVLFMACKGNTLEAACKAIVPAVAPQTIVIPLLNGVMVSDMMAPFLPPCQLADGTIRIFSHRVAPGQIVHTSAPGEIVLGVKGGKNPPLLSEVAALLHKAGLPATVTAEIETASWRKFLFICSNSLMNLYYHGPAGVVRQHRDYRRVLEGNIDNLLAITKAAGVPLPASQKEDTIDFFEQLGDAGMTSLYRDIQDGKDVKDTEFEHLIGRYRALGQKYHVPTPYADAVYKKYRQ